MGNSLEDANGHVETPLKFTPTEERILAVLSDGFPHHRDQLKDCLDELASFADLANHLCRLRAKLKLRGRSVICELRGKAIMYRQVILINPNAE